MLWAVCLLGFFSTKESESFVLAIILNSSKLNPYNHHAKKIFRLAPPIAFLCHYGQELCRLLISDWLLLTNFLFIRIIHVLLFYHSIHFTFHSIHFIFISAYILIYHNITFHLSEHTFYLSAHTFCLPQHIFFLHSIHFIYHSIHFFFTIYI